MSTPSFLPLTATTPKMNVQASRRVLDQALEAAKSGQDTEAELAHKRAINAYTGASVLLPPAVIFTAATAASEQEPVS